MRFPRGIAFRTAVFVATLSIVGSASADYLGKVIAVADGDTFTLDSETGRVRVRICGIDAPERGQPGYGQAAGALAAMVEGKSVHCLLSATSEPMNRACRIFRPFRGMKFPSKGNASLGYVSVIDYADLSSDP
jgi:endonuclease YncB( thermonuclease family)